MNGAIVKFNSLSNADGAGAKHQYFFGRICFGSFVFPSVYGIIVRRLCLKLSGTGVYHFIYGRNAVFIPHFFDFFFGSPRKLCNDAIRKFDTFRLF